MNLVEVAGLIKRFKLKGREVKALDDVSFTVAAGESRPDSDAWIVLVL